VLGCAKTGTGKTLAFALPILQKVMADHRSGWVWRILTPDSVSAVRRPLRYLRAGPDAHSRASLPDRDQFTAFGKQISLKCSVIVGGRHQMVQAFELDRWVWLVVG
jgi:DEAD/DEAH box helicase